MVIIRRNEKLRSKNEKIKRMKVVKVVNAGLRFSVEMRSREEKVMNEIEYKFWGWCYGSSYIFLINKE